MARRSEPRCLRAAMGLPALWLTAVIPAGCGGSPSVHELPEAAKNALTRRKVDVGQQSAKATRAGQRLPQGRSPAQ